MKRIGLKRLEIITALFVVMISMVGIAAANPFDVNIMKASPNQATPAPGLLDLNQGSSVTLSLLTINFDPQSIPGSYLITKSVECGFQNPGCTVSDVVVTIKSPNPATISADPSTLVDQLSVKWTGANDPDGTVYVLTVQVGPGGKIGEVGSASRTIKGHKETPPCTENCHADEYWNVEWFHTKPDQYTEFNLQEGQDYLVTSGFYAPEARIHIWDGDTDNEILVDSHTGDRLKYWQDPNNMEDLYVNHECQDDNCETTLRLYGTFGEGPGDLNELDPVSGKIQENPGYTDPIAPFFPQADDAPRKDHVTFNPAIMEHNFGYPELLYSADGNTVQEPKEKVFQRMSYEKDWFKDDDADGKWDVVIEDSKGDRVASIPIDTWEQYYHDNLPESREEGWRLREHNNHILTPGNQADTYGPAIIKEFTYMTLNTETLPILVDSGSRILIPTANNPQMGTYGLNDFTYTGGSRDYVKVESEATLNLDIDGDGDMDPMDKDGQEVSGDESVVLVLADKLLTQGSDLQFFDNKIHITTVSTGGDGSIVYNVCDNEGGTPTCTNFENLVSGQVKFYTRGVPQTNPSQPKGDFYIKLKNVDNTPGQPSAVIEVGRLFGNTLANIGANKYWNQKAFIVQGVFYNVVAIKAKDNTFKYITFREKLPKEEIKLYGRELHVWDEEEVLPEMPPFNVVHNIMEDVQRTHTWPIQKIGDKIDDVSPLEITYGIEAKEPRFYGELKEIYAENMTQTPGEPETCAGDLNGDGAINFDDFSMFAAAYGTQLGDPNYNADADLNSDDKINFDDFSMFAAVYGSNCAT